MFCDEKSLRVIKLRGSTEDCGESKMQEKAEVMVRPALDKEEDTSSTKPGREPRVSVNAETGSEGVITNGLV